MELRFCPLFSGSSGNALYLGCGDTHLLIDAGMSGAKITTEMERVGLSPKDLTGILVTHEHSDHISGVGILSRRYDIPIFANDGTWIAMRDKLGNISEKNIRQFETGADFHIGCVEVTPFATPHDAMEPVGYSFCSARHKISIATDLGVIRESWLKHIEESDLVLLAARPSMGKTAFALNIIQNAAIRHNVPTAVFSLEMSREQLYNRMLCSEAMLDAQKLRTGELDDNDWVELIRASGPLSEAPIYIDDTPGVTPMEVRSKCRRLKVEKGLGLIVIDYLQLMSGNGRTDSRQQEISEISRSLKALAREMEAPVIALSQLSRACEQRADHRPMLSDLRESGAIEQDADVVAFLYRDEYYFPDTEKKNQAELIIAKQRNGPTGTVDLAWMGQYTKFGNLMKKF